MTGPDDYTNTRPISVAELLAKNGTIGAPPVGGRRRRRRGNADAVTVAELTGEIPIVRPDEPAAPAPAPEPDPEPEQVTESDAHEDADDVDAVADAAEVTEADDELVEVGESHEDEEAEPEDEVEDEAEPALEAEAPVEAEAPRRSPFGRFGRKNTVDSPVDAELMSPDPVDADVSVQLDDVEEQATEEPEDESPSAADAESEDTEDAEDTAEADIDDELPSYLRSTQDPLFGGETVADDVARRGGQRLSEDDLDDDLDDDEEADAPREMSPLVHGLWVVGQSVVAVIFGAGLFFAFDQLWKWNNIVALVLSVLVILGLVVGVRVVRKTEDIGSTLIAVAVGALVTLGPLALLRSG
ncbi:MAG: hypothetical protein AB1925_08330 [Actinomycetota bacterium]